MSVVDAVRRELKELGQEESALGAAALALALSVEDPDSTTSQAMCAKELRETLSAVKQAAPARQEPDSLDELAKKRNRRVARAAAAKG